MELSFCSLRNKEVVNICDGKKLGNIIDLVFDTCYGKVVGIVVPSDKGILSVFKSCNDIFIPYNRICKIGKDIILVELTHIDNKCNDCSTFSNDHNISSHSINIKDYNTN